MDAPKFNENERMILGCAGDDLPDSPTPYADLAQACGVEENTALALLDRLKQSGVIRRFGATLRHQKAGYGHNAMVAWKIDDAGRRLEVGQTLADRPEISHCYLRARRPEWPYDLYTMIHGQSPGDCLKLARSLSEELGVPDFTILESVRELKKTSMTYFPRP
ncbi:MAG: siroheme decarboxylase [Desulfovibrionales bacterium]|jgi:DNA-binding Lrp family transcriptional regulator|nr:siroheme decarboxylase [Desulfovibrionales bacterium]